MKGLIFDIRRFCVHDGPGIRTTVFMKGCPLTCWWCHNPESWLAECEHYHDVHKLDGKEFHVDSTIGKYMEVNEMIGEIEKDLVFINESGGGVTFSGGEPLNQPEFLEEVLNECRNRDIHTAVDTSGYAESGVIERIVKGTNLFLYDIKHMDDRRHIEFTGVSNKTVLENLEFLSNIRKRVIIRFPMIEKVNDDWENLANMSQFLNKLRKPVEMIHLLPYHRIGSSKYSKFGIDNRMVNAADYPKERLEEIRKFFVIEGFRVKVGG